VAAIALLVGSLAAFGGHQCHEESNYYCIRVIPGSEPGVRALVLDSLLHGYVDIRDPTHLVYPYEQLYQQFLAALPPASVRTLFAIGGGTFTFPRYANQKLGSDVLVAEIDPAVTAIARSEFELVDRPGLHIVNEDARRVLLRMDPARRFDVVVGDAFNDAAVPFHLTTEQFDKLVAEHLTEHGVYLMNVVDAVHHDFLRSIVATLRTTFSTVRVLTPAAWPPQESRNTFVVVASRHPVPETAAMVSTEALERFENNGLRVKLTDDHVPVDQLLAPVFRQRLER
jgi:spermidine synthase